MGDRDLPLRLSHVPCPPKRCRANHSVVAVLTTSPPERLRLAKSGLSHSCGKLRPALPPDVQYMGSRFAAAVVPATRLQWKGGYRPQNDRWVPGKPAGRLDGRAVDQRGASGRAA